MGESPGQPRLGIAPKPTPGWPGRSKIPGPQGASRSDGGSIELLGGRGAVTGRWERIGRYSGCRAGRTPMSRAAPSVLTMM